MEGFGLGFPVVKRSGQANGGGGRMRELKANGHQRDARIQVVIVIVFHVGNSLGGCAFNVSKYSAS
jgi:hypothetical protein